MNDTVKRYAGAAAIVTAIATTSCAPIVWDRPGTSPAEFSMDDARCQLMAEAGNPMPDTVYTGRVGRDVAINLVSGFAHGLSVRHTHDLCLAANGYVAQTPAPAPIPTVTVEMSPPNTIVEKPSIPSRLGTTDPSGPPTVFDPAPVAAR